MTRRRFVLVVAVLAVVATAAGIGGRRATSAPTLNRRVPGTPVVAPLKLTPKVVTLKAAAQGEGVPGAKPVAPAPPALPASKLAGLVGVAPGEVYAVLTSRQPYVANRGCLTMMDPTSVDPYQPDGPPDGVVRFASPLSGLMVQIRPHAARARYLVDCTVQDDMSAHMVLSTGMGETRVWPVDGHVLCVIETHAGYWNRVWVQAADGRPWRFYRCVVSYMGAASE